jgi:hypothetical protein
MRLPFSIALFIGCLCAAAYSLSRLRETAPRANVEADIGDAHFSYKEAYARDAATAAGGFANRLAFAVRFPDFAPLGSIDKTLSPRTLDERQRKAVFITISPADESIDPADRPALLYSRFFEGEASTGPGGLIMRKFERGSPYELEQLFIAPPNGRVFFARCSKQAPSGDAYMDMCLWIFRTKSLDAELRFAPALLEHWETLVEDAREFLNSLDATRPTKR